jgi:hypothetical protein
MKIKTTTSIIYAGLCSVALVCFIPLSTHAVNPPPDGGYPGFTTAEGTNALKNLTTGVGNTATGWHSLSANTVGNLNTANGAGALLFNTGDNNTATGALALLSNTTGIENTATGSGALQGNATGDSNTATGFHALHNNTGGHFSTATGFGALEQNITGGENTAVGHVALGNNTTGVFNKALGVTAGSGVTTADNVICIGANGDNVSNSCYIGSIGMSPKAASDNSSRHDVTPLHISGYAPFRRHWRKPHWFYLAVLRRISRITSVERNLKK